MSDDDVCRDCSRRTMIRGIGIAAAASVLGVGCGSDDGSTPDAGDPNAGISMCGASVCLDLSHPANQQLLAVDGARRIMVSNDAAIVIRQSDTEFSVVSSVCTHAGCSVAYNSGLKLLVCPCHGSRFGVTGNVNMGPAARPLKRYPATFDAATMTLSITV
jgi:cytochrome b6-f complex iron-sulfur subunit